MPAAYRTIAVIALVLASGCEPASSTTTGSAEPSMADTNETVVARRIARECVVECDEKHERGSAAHLRCARRCLAVRQGLENDRVREENRNTEAPWGIVFALTVSSALALLATLF